jgi:hypothetical protein
MSSLKKIAVSKFALALAACVSFAALSGCAGRPSLFPNNDKSLRKTSAQFAADAAARHPYKASAPRGGEAVARAEVDYGLKDIKLVNLSDDDWKDVEVWVNSDYVVFVPNLPKQKIEKIYFQSLYNGAGDSFPIHGRNIEKLELLVNGKMYDVKVALP